MTFYQKDKVYIPTEWTEKQALAIWEFLEEIATAIWEVHETGILKALHIPTIEYEKYEADDVLGSLAKKASSKKIHSVLVSTDKDLYQLVDESTTLYNPVKEIHMDKRAVEEHFGVPPSQVVDVLALWGDPSDNVPGVPGIGEKTSKALLQQFRTLENLLKNMDQIQKPPLREKIKENLCRLRYQGVGRVNGRT